MSGSAKVLTKMNEQMDIQSIQQVLKTFNKETMKAEMNQDAVRYQILHCLCMINNQIHVGQHGNGHGHGECG